MLEETLASKDKEENAQRKHAAAKRTPYDRGKFLSSRSMGSSLGKKDFKMLEKDYTNKALKNQNRKKFITFLARGYGDKAKKPG